MAAPNTLIAGRYRLVRLLGAGGMGVVWEARDERLERQVAVKQLRTEAGLSGPDAELAKQRAMREARITARLHHPNAVSVFDVVEHEGQPCLVMQLVPSIPLTLVLRELKVLEPSEAARVGAQVASALAAAHSVGIVHRDVKPGNVLIGDDGVARISDFGISRALGDSTLTTTGMVTGTPAYLAPEVARGAESNFASDVFSLGATLYTAVEGAPPFGTDQNFIALLHKVSVGEFPAPQRAGELSQVLGRMLSRDPQDRPPMTDVAHTLAGLAAPASNRPGTASATATTLVAPLTEADHPERVEEAQGQGEDEPARSRDVTFEPVPAVSPAPPPPVQLDPPPKDGRRGRGLLALLTAALLGAVVLAATLLPSFRDTTTAITDPNEPATRTGSASASASPVEPSPEPSAEPSSSPSASAKPSPTRSASATPSATPTPTATPSPTKTRAPTKTRTSAAPQPVDGTPTAAELAAAITTYYALMPDDLDSAWPRMTVSYQSNTAQSRNYYEEFWGEVDEVSVSDVQGSPPETAQATVTYRYKDGRVVRERTEYQLVEDDGVLKINRSRVLSSAAG